MVFINKFRGFSKFNACKSNFVGGKILKFLSSINLSRTHKFGTDRFSRFDVYWIQTDKHTQTNKQSIYIDYHNFATYDL